MIDRDGRKIIFKCKTGSQLYGTQTPESDTDYLSVFMPFPEDVLGLQKREIVESGTKKSDEKRQNTKEDVDDTSYSLPRYLKLVIDNNPNIIETLFVPEEHVVVCEPEFKTLLDNYGKIVSQKAKHTFSGYAYSQKKKLMTKRERFLNLGHGIKYIETYLLRDQATIDIVNGLENKSEYRKLTDDESRELNNILKYYKSGITGSDCNSFHKGMDLGMVYRKLVNEHSNYGWRLRTDTFEKLGYDCKFGYHLIRLQAEGIELLQTGRLRFPLKGKVLADINRIRNAEVGYDELMTMYDEYNDILEAVIKTTEVRKTADFNYCNQYLVSTLLKEFR